jgi:hypothetical protein
MSANTSGSEVSDEELTDEQRASFEDWQELREEALNDAKKIEEHINRLAARSDLNLGEKARRLQELIDDE